jgi:hypothetical protein
MTPAGVSLINGVTYYFSVKSENRAGSQSAVSVSDGILADLTMPGIPGTPADTLPAGMHASFWNDNYTSTTTLAWTWSASTGSPSGITGYYVCLSTVSGGADIYNDSFTMNTSFLYTAGQSGYRYYIKVKTRSNSNAYSAYSQPSNGIMIDITPPALPVITDDGQWTKTNTELWVTINSADPDSGISQYEYQVGSSSTGPADIVTQWTVIPATSVTTGRINLSPGTWLAGTSRYVNARTKNGTGVYSIISVSDGIWYDGIAPDVSLIKPVPAYSGIAGDGTYLVNSTIITWAWPVPADYAALIGSINGSGTTSYYVTIGHTAGTADVIDTLPVQSTWYSFKAGENNTRYYLKIKSQDNAGWVSDYSLASIAILVDTNPPSGVMLTQPVDGRVFYNQTPSFEWVEPADFESGINRYVMQLSTSDRFDTVAYSSETKNAFILTTSFNYDRYYWRVTAVDNAANYGAWSSTRMFTVLTLPAMTELAVSTTGLKTTGTDVTTVTVTIKDNNGYLADNSTAAISLSITGPGTLSNSTIVAVNGIATAYITSTKSSGTITITAYSAGLATSTAVIENRAENVPYRIDMQFNKSYVMSTGYDTVILNCTIKDVFNNPVINNPVLVTVSINELGGFITSPVITVSTVTAKGTVIIQSSTTAGNIAVTATAYGITGSTAAIQSVSQPPVKVACAVLPAVITADGISTTTIIARIADTNDNTVPVSSYTTVVFDVIGEADFFGTYNLTTKGTPYVTVQNGIATIQLVSRQKAGVVTITAEVPGLIPGTLSVVTISSVPARLLLSTQKTVLVADNDDFIMITASVVDKNNNLVTTAISSITFAVYHNNVSRGLSPVPTYVTLSTAGIAAYKYSDTVAGEMTIIASAPGLESGTIKVTNLVSKTAGGYYLFNDTSVNLYVPAWAFSNDVQIEFTSMTAVTVTDTNIGIVPGTIKELVVKDSNNQPVTGLLNQPVTITISYDATVTNEDNLKIFFVESPGKVDWLRSSKVNKTNKTVSAQTTHFSIFMLAMFNQTDNVLFQNYPNPFNPEISGTTRIEYSLSSVILSGSPEGGSRCSVRIYNIASELVRTLVDDVVIPGNKNYVDWDGKNINGELVADGVYLCQLITPSYKKIIKIIVVK